MNIKLLGFCLFIYVVAYQYIAIGIDFNNRNFLITGIIAMTAVISIFISEYENSKIQILGLISVLLSVEILKIIINWNIV